MTSILFVDDDAIIRRSMQKTIDWGKEGMHLEYAARDGIDAIKYLQNHKVDIILSDIKMPVLDGIQMAKKIIETHPHMLFIFLSGYEDFAYAKEALKLSAVDYLSKPISNDKLIFAIHEAEKKLELIKKNQAALYYRLLLVRRNFLNSLFNTPKLTMNDATLMENEICMENEIGILGYITFSLIENPLNVEHTHQVDKMCNKLEYMYNNSIFTMLSYSHILFFIKTSQNSKQSITDFLLEVKNNICSVVKKNIRSQCNIFFSSTFSEVSKLSAACIQLKKNIFNSQHITEKVKEYIFEHYSDSNLTLKSIAKVFSINHCHLTVIFKKQFGLGVYSFLIKTRLEHAKHLLSRTNKNLCEITDLVGFSNSQYLSVCFKKYFNQSISQFKRDLG